MKKKQQLQRVWNLINRIEAEVMGVPITLEADFDKIFGKRIFLRTVYQAPCTKTGTQQKWSGRKWYLSEHMLDDEIIKTSYAAVEACVKHEMMEGFKVDGKILFNPHINFEKLLELSHHEVARETIQTI